MTSIGRRRCGGPKLRLGALPLIAAVALVALAGQSARAAQWDNGFHFWFPFFDHRQQQQPTPAPQPSEPRPQIDYSRAPPPKKSDTSPATRVVVMGDAMADWLAYGLEDAFSESPEVGVVRKHHTNSGLIHGESKSAYDWPQAARDTLAGEKADIIVMMIGLADRQPIREKQVRGNPAKPNPPAGASRRESSDPAGHDEEGQPAAEEPVATAAPEPTTRTGTTSVYEFHSEQWAELYAKRIDEMIAVLKSKGVPVFWVGLPAVRGTRSTADIAYLNNLYRGRAEKAGITFVDVWDGFIDESGNFTTHGPDFEGQTRRLRSADGVYFTKAGAQKLAHYAEREIGRAMLTHNGPLATPAPEEPAPQTSAHQGTQPARPAAGPVVPLTTVSGAQEELLGGSPAHTPAPDPNATKVLVNGEPPASLTGRADDFAWPKPASVVAPPASGGAAAQPADKEMSDSPPPKAAASPKPAAAPEGPPHTPKRAPRATAARSAPPPVRSPAPMANDWMGWLRPPAPIRPQ
jgi:uncharacterized protein